MSHKNTVKTRRAKENAASCKKHNRNALWEDVHSSPSTEVWCDETHLVIGISSFRFVIYCTSLYYDQVINKTHLKFGCLQFLLKCNNTKVQEIKNSVTFIVGLVLILWNGLLFVQSIQ